MYNYTREELRNIMNKFCEEIKMGMKKAVVIENSRKINVAKKEKLIDYTKWQKDLYNDIDVEKLGKMSYEYCKNN